MELSIYLLHFTATLFMTGLIWFVQVVHYPLFSAVEASAFSSYEAAHTQRTTWVVAPAMMLEALTGIALLWQRPEFLPAPIAAIGVLLILAIWISTGSLQVPQHRILVRGFSGAAHRRLVAGNWVRTAAWTLRSALLLWYMARP